MRFKNFSPQDLRDAIEIELQKTDDPKTASIIAIKNLSKNPRHYVKMEKARPTKYIKRIPKPGGKGYTYIYAEDKKEKKESWMKKMASFFGFKDEKQAMQQIATDYKKNEIDKKYNLTWDSWKNHISEYFLNKEKWDTFFSKKKSTEKKEKVKSKTTKPTKGGKKVKKDGIKLSIMKEIFKLYGSMSQQAAPIEKVTPVLAIFDASTPAEEGWAVGPGGMTVAPNKDIIDKTIKTGEWFVAGNEALKDKFFPTREDAIIAWKKDNFETMPESEQTPADIKKDKEIAKELNSATPENRAEVAANVMDEEKQPWGMTFEELKKQTFGSRDQNTIDRLKKNIESYKEHLETITKKEGKESTLIKHRWAYTRMEEYEKLLEQYLEGTIDENLKPKESWDYLQKKYDSLSNKASKEGKSLKRKLNIRENKLKKEHERLIKNAIKNGEIIPANVLKEYPEIMANEAKNMDIPDPNYKPKEYEQTFNVGISAESATLKIKDYSKLPATEIYLADPEIILDVKRPSYIPELSLESFAGYRGKTQTFDVVRLEANKYILVDERYKTDDATRMGAKFIRRKEQAPEKELIENSSYYLLNAETLAATWDYYQKLYVATELKKHEEKEDREEEHYNRKKKEYAEKGKKWPYAPFKRKGKRVPIIEPDSTEMAYRNAFFITDILGIKNPEGKGITISQLPQDARATTPVKAFVFESYRSMLRELNFKINDMSIQKQMDGDAGTYKKGQETAYGEGGTKDDLIPTFGVKVKRQNGSEVDDQDITRIGILMEDIFSVFGNRKEMSKKANLKISYAGTKRMHASKAIGMFVPKYNTIAISDDGIEGRGFTFAHEFTHFMDSYLGDQMGHHFASDKDGSIENTIAKTFRKNMALKGDMGKKTIQYYNRTCECFARAMEQFYAIKQGTEKELYSFRNDNGEYPPHDVFMQDIMPLCEQFLKERNEMLKAIKKEFFKIGKTIFYKKQGITNGI